MADLRPDAGRRSPANAVIGVLFLAVAAVAAWSATGHRVDARLESYGIPVFLIVLGVLAVTRGRRR